MILEFWIKFNLFINDSGKTFIQANRLSLKQILNPFQINRFKYRQYHKIASCSN